MSTLLIVFGGIALLNVYALLLVVLRGPVYRTRIYRPMLLNIALSVAPIVVLVGGLLLMAFFATGPLPDAVRVPAVLTTVIVFGIAWLLLLPNAAYLITELNFSHRRDDESVPLWYDIVSVLTLALSGVLNALANVALVQLTIGLIARPNDEHPYAHPESWIAAAVVLLLVPFGIYLGRYLRVNSWDLRHPVAFAGKVLTHFRARENLIVAVGFTATHAVLLAILYTILLAPLLLQFA